MRLPELVGTARTDQPGQRHEWDVGHDGELIRASLRRPDVFAEIFAAHHPANDGYCVRRIGDAGEVTPASGIRSRASLLSTPEDSRDG